MIDQIIEFDEKQAKQAIKLLDKLSKLFKISTKDLIDILSEGIAFTNYMEIESLDNLCDKIDEMEN